ncbi:M28 family peptidase [Marinicella sp. S1101]|uniref:M28 family metallopeptidase n=1 Tax=Marinicella marina TaxID=2996016 RepID=UPI002260D6ED|nr:M28 family peptidase [Marinicella marina]MCX7553536.1 M28 family peptidase [Marinicella marina]MDJ1140160.1 M28 family peptidase [Marinicella marina]
MHKIILAVVIFCLTLSFNIWAEVTDISLLEINKIGAEKVTAIKSHPKVDWWVEMGDKMIVSFNDSTETMPSYTQVLATTKSVDLSDLMFKSNGHCSSSDPDDTKHENAVKNSHDIHAKVEPIFRGGGHQLVAAAGFSDKVKLVSHNEFRAFKKNTVLSYQFDNRNITKSQQSDTLAAMLNQVDENRYFSQLEILASHDRLTEMGMVGAGEWLEGRFNDLGLNTYRIDPHNHIGFNVLAFKQGVTKPDDWYVVGAHLDSRNEDFNWNRPSPGAEDNASGCAGVLEIANVISNYDTESSILFVCFNAEERGLWGSADVVTVLGEAGDLGKVKFMQNMDMIASRANTVSWMNAGTDKAEYVQYAEILAANGNLYTDIDWYINPNACCTDFKSFSAAKIPSISSTIPIVMDYEHYHTTTDLPIHLDKVQGAGVVKAHLATLVDLVGIEPDTGFSVVPAHSGMWYNPDQSGHGLTIEVLPGNRILLVWYVFDQLGNQIWLVGAGEYDGSVATVDVTISELGLFPPEFNTADVNSTLWGTLQIEFDGCNTAMFSWAPAEGVDYSAGSMPLTRLTAIDGMTCSE